MTQALIVLGVFDSNCNMRQNLNSIFRADAARQKSEALRSLATQLIEEHDDYTKKNEKVFSDSSLSIIVIFTIIRITKLTIIVIFIINQPDNHGHHQPNHNDPHQVAEYRLEERNRDVHFWKNELEEETEAMKVTKFFFSILLFHSML